MTNEACELAERIHRGELVVPHRCQYCRSKSIVHEEFDGPFYRCISCGRVTHQDDANRDRRARIKIILQGGEEVW